KTGAHDGELATEQEFATLFPGCELGAMPPFGNLYGLDTYVTRSLADDEEIAFNSGTHTELIRMPYRDFERVVHPKAIDSGPADKREAAERISDRLGGGGAACRHRGWTHPRPVRLAVAHGTRPLPEAAASGSTTTG